jgi:hypothetical protein
MVNVPALDLPKDLTDVPATGFKGVVEPLPMSKDEKEVVAAVRGTIDEHPQATFLARVEAEIDANNTAPPVQADASESLRRVALATWWYFAQGLDAGGARRFDEAIRCFRRAAYGFARLGDEEQLEAAVFQAEYNAAALLAQQGKFPEAQEKFARLVDGAENSSAIGKEQREKLASLEFETLLQEAGEAGRRGNTAQAAQLLQSLAERLKSMAAGHDQNDPAYRLWAGNAGMLVAQAALANGIATISLYNFDHVAQGASAAAEDAALLLEDVSPANAAMTKYYARLLGALEELATIMLRVLNSTFRGDQREFRALRARVTAAREVIPSAVGVNPDLLRQQCDQMDQWVGNLERLARPGKRQIISYGGLVTCVAFCVLLLVVAALNKAFSLDATAATIFSTCTPLALVAGFGLAGLRVWRSGRPSGAGDAA